jgi:hypothetical protein
MGSVGDVRSGLGRKRTERGEGSGELTRKREKRGGRE